MSAWEIVTPEGDVQTYPNYRSAASTFGGIRNQDGYELRQALASREGIMTLTTKRVRTFYTTATGWAMPGAYREKPKREARLERSRALLEAEFDKWLAAHDAEVARGAIFAASDEFLNGHQADRPDSESMRTGVPVWFNQYAVRHYGSPTSMDAAK